MSEPKINVATGFNGGVSISLRADSAAEFEAILADAHVSPTLSALLSKAGLGATETQAVQNIVTAFPQAQVSTVGQPLPQPAAQPVTYQPIAAPAAQPAAPSTPPPTVVNPGPCVHGERIYKDTVTKNGPWRRWECALPWSKGADNSQRCAAIKVA